MNISTLSASGFRYTNNELHAFAGKTASFAKETFKDKPVFCSLWGFRHDGCEILSCDLSSPEQSIRLPITIMSTGSSLLEHLDGIEVIDMVEALHLASLIIHGVGATVVTGRHSNEINESLFAKPLREHQASSPINLWRHPNKDTQSVTDIEIKKC